MGLPFAFAFLAYSIGVGIAMVAMRGAGLRMFILAWGFGAILLIALADARGHVGGLDSNGGHTNRKTSEYHCHKEGCVPGGKSPDTYNRKAFGSAWVDEEGDCLNTRHEVLRVVLPE